MFINRIIQSSIQNHLDKKEYTIITGARQTGKTTIISQFYKALKEKSDRVFFLSFENSDILRDINKSPENIFKYALRPENPLVKNEASKRVVIFIDEIQYAANPSHFLKYLFDKYLDNLKIVATGSSAFYLDSSFKDSLAGRKRIFVLQTLSFEEFLLFLNRKDLLVVLDNMRKQADYVSAHQNEMLDLFNEYLIYGAYPAVVLEKDINEKIEHLRELKNSFLKRDIEDSGVGNTDAFYKLTALLSGQTCNLVNRNELANTIGIDNKTIERYLFILQKCFHIELLKPFSGNLRKELTKMPMVYFYDLGMRNVLANRFFPIDQREDKGQLLENYVFKRLSEKYPIDDIKFWRTTDNKEIDFVVNGAVERLAFEVKFSCKKQNNKAAKVFLENYKNYTFKTISYNFDEHCLQALKL